MSKLGVGFVGIVMLLSEGACSGKASLAADRNGGGAGSPPASGGNVGSAGAHASGSAGVASAAGGAAASVGGSAGSGGTVDVGGGAGSGGVDADPLGAGGASGASIACGGPMGIKCPVGQLCDAASNCGQTKDVMGVCVALPKFTDCSDMEDPEGPSCGCDGKNWVNDCTRQVFGVPEAANGACSSGGIASYPTAYGVWLAVHGDGGVGPAVVVTAAGSIRVWDSVSAFLPDSPPPNPTNTKPLPLIDTDDLFLRIEGVPLDSLPHEPGLVSNCHLKFYFRICESCAIRAVIYESPSQVLPEMEAAWLWFDRILGPSAPTNPRNFCK